jgi:hypothetical protein
MIMKDALEAKPLENLYEGLRIITTMPSIR